MECCLSVTKAYIVDYNTAVRTVIIKNSIRRTGSTHIRIAQCRTACCSYRCLLYRIHLSGSTISPCHRICLSRTPAVLCPRTEYIHVVVACSIRMFYRSIHTIHHQSGFRKIEIIGGTVVCSSPLFLAIFHHKKFRR